jgi:hypothetical protein
LNPEYGSALRNRTPAIIPATDISILRVFILNPVSRPSTELKVFYDAISNEIASSALFHEVNKKARLCLRAEEGID